MTGAVPTNMVYLGARRKQAHENFKSCAGYSFLLGVLKNRDADSFLQFLQFFSYYAHPSQ